MSSLVIPAAALIGAWMLANKSGIVSGGGIDAQNPPGTVLIGGQPAPNSWQPSNIAGKATAFGTTAVGATGAIGGLASGGSAAFGATALGSALPIIGVGIAIVGTVLGAIAKHHAEAVKAEANGLNAAVPQAIQRHVLVLQAAIRKEISTVAEAQTLTNQTIADYYTQTKTILRGKWPWNPTGTQSPVPSTCNGPCTVGHYWVEGFVYKFILPAVQEIVKGNHGTVTLPSIPSHAGFSGMPEIKVFY